MRVFAYILFLLMFLFTSCEPTPYDDSAVLDKINGLEERVDELEERIDELEAKSDKAAEDIAALRAIIDVLESRDYVTSVTPIMNGDEVVGYTITFANSAPLTIYNCHCEDEEESIIVGVTDGETEVIITLSDGSTITIPKGTAPAPTDYCEKLEDTEFMRYCYEKFDINGDKILSESEAKAIRAVNIDSKQSIYSVKGIEYFVNLESFQAYNAIALRTLDLSKNTNLRTIKEQALYKCSGLESVILPPTIETIEDDAFHKCPSLASINIPEGVKSIGICAFAGASALTEIAIPQSVTTIGKNAFAATGLHSIIIPEGVAVIEYSTFYNCKSLNSIVLPSTITSIGDRTFDYCYELKEIHCKATTPPTLEMFSLLSNIPGRKIYVPHGSVEAYKTAENWSEFAEEIVGE
jgi:hypothetical protein